MLSKSGIVFTTVVFYATVFLFLSFNVTPQADTTSSVYGIVLSIAFGNVINNIAHLGWINAIIFTPLLIVFGWVIATSVVPTINSGA